MFSSRGTTSLSSAKRVRLPQSTRARKKQKRLVAICDEPAASFLAHRGTAEEDAASLRRSSRIRRAPVLLDSSPVPSGRRKKHKDRDPRSGIRGGNERNLKRKGKEPVVKQGKVLSSAAASVGEGGDWRSRLRARGGKGLHYSFSLFREPDTITDEASELLRPVMGGEKIGFDSSVAGGSRKRKTMCVNEVSVAGDEVRNQEEALASIGKEYTTGSSADRASEADQVGVVSNTKLGLEETQVLELSESKVEFMEESECVIASLQDGGPCLNVIEEGVIPHRSQEMGHIAENFGSDQSCKHIESHDANSVERDALKDNITEDSLKDNDQRVTAKEARRCGLCGCGSDGKPPRKLVLESLESENEAYGGSSASEEPNYDVWDGFGDEPCWLGRLLGPIRDRFGIARVWVHQLCAVWSPEVYFAGLGCLKNVRAALCRGRALKCSRCGRPGATIGCRVDRCPKTYHLPCSRVEGCIFDHRKFLIACNDHRRFFQPQGNKYSVQLKKMKARKLRLDLRKMSNESRRKDLEAEEKWLENCGEDEEFLRREGRRLQRDIVRIAPAYIGGSSENDKMYQGWESVAGLEHVIQCMKEVVMLPLLYPDFFANLGLTPPRGVLLHGYPGTGKTHVVRALIGACSTSDKRIAYFARKGADCLGKYVGDAERQLRLLFQVAEKSQPSIIFFDEIDGLAPRRSKQQDQTHSSVVSTLLSLLDGLKSRGSVIVIGATNRPDAVDPALRRPGRFDREIYFPLPSERDRSAIISLHTRSWPKPLCGSLLSWIANQTVGYAGADLQALCTQAAMHALKRSCSLQGLLSSAEKGTIQGILSTLPSFDVEERDWLAALILAPPPCSRREAGIAANDIVASPLPIHLVPSLLLPLVHLLISLYNDERIWLSPVVLKASKTLKNVIVSALELKCLPSALWQAHLHNLFKNQLVVDKVKKCFAHYGLIIGPLGFDYPFIMDDQDNEPPGSLDSVRMNPSAVYMHGLLLQRCPLQIGNSVGFRALICGAPRSGQKHLASCLLHGFVGNLEIRKVSLATIAQEGRGDMLHGLTQILLKCLDVGRCIIYMPRIDLWAIEGSENLIANDNIATQKSTSSSLPEMLPVGRSTSEIWNSFAEQLDSVPMATSLAILATCEVEKEDIPPGLRQFFLSDTRSHAESNPTEYRIPRFFVQLDGDFDFEQSINLAAAKLSHDIVQHYLKLMHERSHLKCLGDVYKSSNYTEINLEDCKRRSQHATVTLEGQDRSPLLKKTIATTLNIEHIAAGDQFSCGNDNVLHGVNNKRLPQTRDWGVLSQRYGLQGSFLRAAKVVKGNLILAIATFGYQILRYPQFAELCWVTSKLKEGPCTDISGPWKGWPFNTCVLHAECSPNKVVSVANSGNANDKENSSVVRGLIAVGLLAYRGFYASVVEVSAEVRNVLELLVGKIRAKISLHADKQRYFRILSQAAYLDDMVNSWAYMLQSLQADNNIAEFVSKTSAEGRLQSDDNNIRDIKIAGNPSKGIAADESCNIASPRGCFTINGECANTEKELNDSDAEAKDLSEVVERSGIEDSLLSKGAANGDNGFTLKGSCNLSRVSCLYLCCPGCVQMIKNLVLKTLCNHVKSTGCYSMVDDAHDVIVSSSLNILSSFKKCCGSESSADVEVSFRSLFCPSQLEEEDDVGFTEFPCHCRESKIQLLPKECVCHARMEDDTLISNTCSDSILESRSAYFFRDGVLVPVIPEKGVELHCNFEKVCLCSIVMMLLFSKQIKD